MKPPRPFFVFCFLIFTSMRAMAASDLIAERSIEAAAAIAQAKAEWQILSTVPAKNRASKTNMRVPYKMLWIGYENGTCDGKKYTMTDAEKQLLKDTAALFEKNVEEWSNNNVDIQIKLVFSAAEVDVSKTNSHAITFEQAAGDIAKFSENDTYDSIITASTIDDAILGLKTMGIEDPIGYSTFQLNCRGYATVALNTAVAIHEWLHQSDSYARIIGVIHPHTHIYQGAPNFPNWGKIEKHPTNDFLELYENMIRANVPYFGDQITRHTGIFPAFWNVNHATLDIGIVTIKNRKTAQFLSANGTGLTHSANADSDAQKWHVYYNGDGTHSLISKASPWLRMDVFPWTNQVKLFLTNNTNYPEAQNFRIIRNANGTYKIQSIYGNEKTKLKSPPVLCANSTGVWLGGEVSGEVLQEWEIAFEGVK